MSLTHHIGFGRFRLEHFRGGEVFARYDGSLARVCEDQPYLERRPDHILVWIDCGTGNARRVLLHRTALAHATCSEQAAHLERRIRRRGEQS